MRWNSLTRWALFPVKKSRRKAVKPQFVPVIGRDEDIETIMNFMIPPTQAPSDALPQVRREGENCFILISTPDSELDA